MCEWWSVSGGAHGSGDLCERGGSEKGKQRERAIGIKEIFSLVKNECYVDWISDNFDRDWCDDWCDYLESEQEKEEAPQ